MGVGETLSQDRVSAAFGDSVAEGTTLRTVGQPEDGVLEASHPDYGASMWYNSACVTRHAVCGERFVLPNLPGALLAPAYKKRTKALPAPVRLHVLPC